jgi:hypothetical protein
VPQTYAVQSLLSNLNRAGRWSDFRKRREVMKLCLRNHLLMRSAVKVPIYFCNKHYTV